MRTVEERFLLLSFAFVVPIMLLMAGIVLASLVLPVLSGQDEIEILWRERLAWRYGLLIVGITSAAGILLPLGQVWLLRRLVVGPLRDLREATTTLDQDGVPGPAPVHRLDEIGEVAQAYNEMVEKVKESRESAVLKERLAALGELSAGILHEVRNPLAAIVGYCDLLSRDLQDGEEREIVAKIRREAEALTDLSNRFLAFAKPLHVELVEFRVGDLLAEVAETFQHLSVASRHEIRVDCPMGLPSLLADRAVMKQCLVDLGSNGIEAMPDGGALVFSARVGEGGIFLDVSDSGKGMTEEELSHAFDPFYTQKEDGTGLGLSMVFKMIEAHQGRVTLRSEQGKGTVASLFIPDRIPPPPREEGEGVGEG